MATVNRTNIIQEPGLLQFNSETFFSATPIVANLVESVFTIPSDTQGPVDDRPRDRRIEIQFTPVGELEALATLFPMGGLTLGASLFGVSDTPVTISTPSGKSLVVHNCAVTSQPSVIGGHDKTLFGSVTITGLIRNNVAPDSANSLYTYTASGATYPGDAAFSPSQIKTLGYAGAWGASAPWSSFVTEEGFTLSTAPNLTDVKADGFGTVDMRLNSLEATMTATPIGITPAQLEEKFAMQGSGNELGASKATGDDLIFTNNVGSLQFHAQLYGAILQNPSLAFSANQRGVGSLTWKATREIVAGVANPLYYVGTSAPA